jgi:hypothetical protein
MTSRVEGGAERPATWSERLLVLPGEPSSAGLAVRGGGLLLLALWTLAFLRHGLDPEYLAASFMHLVHIPFHEAGHVLMSPFGRFVMVLGGSLFQVAVPLACGGVLLVKTKDAFGAAVTAWWAGQSLVDLAPYIADARALQLVLLGGHTGAEVEGHDWEYLLQTMGWLHRDAAIGRLSFALGSLLMVAALGWGAAVVWRNYRQIRVGAGSP